MHTLCPPVRSNYPHEREGKGKAYGIMYLFSSMLVTEYTNNGYVDKQDEVKTRSDKAET